LDILYLSQYFHPEQFLNNHIAAALAARGHKVEVVCCVPNYPSGQFYPGYDNRRRTEERWNGVDIHRVFTVPRGSSAVQLIANYLTYPLAASWRIMRLGRSRGAISFVSMPSPLFQALAGIFAKRVWKIPTVYWVQDIWPDSAIITLGIRNRLAVRILEAVCGWIYRQADLVMVQSDGFHDSIARFGVPADRIVTLPNCAPDTFAPVAPDAVPARIRSLIPRGRRIVMFAGNIGESQDFDTVIDAVAAMPEDSNALLVVIGSGRDEQRVRARVAQEGLAHRFLFLGRHPESDMPAFFGCADVMLVSLRDEPIFSLTVPSKVQAYMACGKAMLASLAGEGARIIRESDGGIVVPPGSPAALADAMTKVASMSEHELSALGCRNRRIFQERYSLNSVVEQLVDQLEAVLVDRQ
jgi:glycosyltransferase involved in cell wall biosynthesis